uniref:Malonyl-coenzyme A:anthocyanin 3-O-glucoside-6''-O-malonyltransferase-like n=1 Tax=Tanacetum cinerariifolium TaxID=118510 RepID=A0A6L2JC18_TANCI|nr:malonyl-coenzyme A:anthocyanin 3-O-glucoside-6''-O-malonyltransferase-like [Tanacetum cinerariifolium]
MVIPLFAVQVTFYENSGFSIGITNHHVLCDASTKYDFLMAWTSIARHACAYVWSCIAKSRAEVEGTKGEDELERFVCVANFRSRMDPPLPQTYFGNCVAPCVAITKSLLLSGNKGFLVAVETLGVAISKTVKNKDELLKDDELWFEMLFKIPAKIPAKIGVAGTPKVKIYDIDFGWEKPKKYETISIDCNGSITVNACKEAPDDLEIGSSLPDKQKNAFIAIFDRELQSFF